MTREITTLTRDEKSLLLYLESRAVDHSGKVAMEKMNDADRVNAKRWNEEGFISFGRIAHADIFSGSTATHWVHLSQEAWETAHLLRRKRAEDSWQSRRYQTTDEKRNVPTV